VVGGGSLRVGYAGLGQLRGTRINRGNRTFDVGSRVSPPTPLSRLSPQFTVSSKRKAVKKITTSHGG